MSEHHSFVRGNHEGVQVDSGLRCLQHAAHKIFVSRDIDHSDRSNFVQLERRKAEIDRYSAPFFLGKAISVDARQSLHQSSLSVVDVSGSADDQAAVQRSCSHTANARSGRSSLKWAPRNSRSSR